VGHDSWENGSVLQRNTAVGIKFLWHRVHPRGPGQESSSRFAVKDRIIPGLDSARCFCPRHWCTERWSGSGRQATQRVDKPCNEALLVQNATPTSNSNDWRTPFVKYLLDGLGFQDKMENERLIWRAKNYILVDGKLTRKNTNSEFLLKCITQDDGIKLLDDIHAVSYGNHVASRTLVGKAFRARFYWPTAVADAEKLVRHCEGCQFFAKRTHVPAHEIQTIPLSWPFACWGLDMIGPFKPAPGNFKFVFVLINKFSKWIEYMPLVKATSKKAVEFLNQIIHRFRIPNSIITDLGTLHHNP